MDEDKELSLEEIEYIKGGVPKTTEKVDPENLYRQHQIEKLKKEKESLLKNLLTVKNNISRKGR